MILFTGLVANTARVLSVSSSRITIECAPDTSRVGDSISVNGVCLTLTGVDKNVFTFDVSYETISSSNLGGLKSGDTVNIEKALALHDGIHGHFVTGHVDTTAKISAINKTNIAWDVTVVFDDQDLDLLKWTADKASICINGVSLTINKTANNSIGLTLIPHTLEKTNLMDIKIGQRVNVEFDILSKYVEKLVTHTFSDKKLLQNKKSKIDKGINSNITEQKLRELGYVK